MSLVKILNTFFLGVCEVFIRLPNLLHLLLFFFLSSIFLSLLIFLLLPWLFILHAATSSLFCSSSFNPLIPHLPYQKTKKPPQLSTTLPPRLPSSSKLLVPLFRVSQSFSFSQPVLPPSKKPLHLPPCQTQCPPPLPPFPHFTQPPMSFKICSCLFFFLLHILIPSVKGI